MSQRLRQRDDVIVQLAKRLAVHATLDDALRDIAATAAAAMETERVGVWFFTDDHQAIRCAELFERTPGRHSSGAELTASKYPNYFRAIERERTIAAGFDDPRISEYASDYLRPHGITAMLDAGVRHLGRVTGVVCHEHVGAVPREWTAEDESFASSVADLVSMALDAAEHRQAESVLEHRLAYEQLMSSISTQFINLGPDAVDAGIRDALGTVAGFIGGDRAFIYILTERGTASLEYEWTLPGRERRETAREFSVEDFPWTMTQMRKLRHIAITTDDIPPDAAKERELYESAGTRSLLAVPMVVNRDPIGVLGITATAPRRWADEAQALLRMTGEIFAGALERARADRELRVSESRYRLLIERLHEGVIQADNDNIIRLANNRFSEITGYSREELIGRNGDFLLAYPDDVLVMQSKARLRMRGVSDQYEVRVRRKDGTVIWLHISGAPVTDAAGNVVGSIGIHTDITERRMAEQALRDSEARYRLMAENSTDMIARTDPRGGVLYASEASIRLLGFDPAEMIGRSVYDFIHLRDADEVRQISRMITDTQPMTFSYRVRKKNGDLTWFETTSRALRDPGSGRVTEIVSVSRDISERKRVEEEIEHQAYHDALTGLPNRRLFRDRLTVALAHARRMRQPLAVMFLDLDRFKVVNDTLGHSLGDELLKAVASRLRLSLREEDSVARMGGDEFTVLLTNLNDPADAAKIAHKVLDVVAQPMHVEGHDLFLTTSIGIALFPNDGESAEVLLKNADHAMYRAKDAGRNSVQLFTAAMNSRALERLSLENSLRVALDRGELLLHYQPQIRIETNEIVGTEALLRWRRPGFGVVEPVQFIPIAEETRLILPIGEWVLREACKQAKRWQASRFPNLRMSVNLSPRQFGHADLPAQVAAALDESGLPAKSLELEITESVAMQNTQQTLATLHRLREMGVRIAMDDFGTGHSSLNYLRTFPIDSVKIDQQFVHEIETSAADRAIVAAIISMAHSLGLRVTAEGVETPAQLEYLRERGCEEVQGFLFGRAVGAEEM